jgi:hypothetical protein
VSRRDRERAKAGLYESPCTTCSHPCAACCRHPQTLEACLAASAPAVLSAFAEKHAPNHGAMWEALLIYCRHFPAAWDSVDVAKAVLPRLTAFLRC